MLEGIQGNQPRTALANIFDGQRASGVLAHVTALPGGHGIGDLGPASREFVDWLHRADQSAWQVLPLTMPAGGANSPYDAFSTFAGNRWLLSLDDLERDGLLEAGTARSAQARSTADAAAVDYDQMRALKGPLIDAASDRLLDLPAGHALRAEFDDFVATHGDAWLDDYVQFMALRRTHGDADRGAWPVADRTKQHAATVSSWDRAMSRDAAEQFLVARQTSDLRAYAGEHGVRLIGDIPIYVGDNSADVWANPHLFQLDPATGHARATGGAPPDAFTEAGQNWGTPVYDWAANDADDFSWWSKRMGAMFDTYDAVRFDHLLGLGEPWVIPAGAQGAWEGAWQPGPGASMLRSVEARLDRPMPMVGEDLGELTDARRALVADSGMPQMRVLVEALSSDAAAVNEHLPANLATSDVVSYTGTHDYPSIAAWNAAASPERAAAGATLLGVNPADADPARLAAAGVDAVMQSRAQLAVARVEDVLGLDWSFNTPGTVGPHNWSARLGADMLSGAAADDLASMTRAAARVIT